MGLPTFSVITVSYNQGEFIKKTIDSVLEQNYPDFEHIVVDGGSTDNTLEILKSYPHLKWTSEPDRGISHALNKGFERATGDVIAWINSDDWYAPGAFHEVAKLIVENPIVLGNAEQTDRAGNLVCERKNYARSIYDLMRYWVPHAWLAQPGVFFTRKALEQVRAPDGTYVDESMLYSMDYDLWLRLGARFPLSCHIDKTLAYFRVYGDNKTGHVFATPQRELGRAYRRATIAMAKSERRLTFILAVSDVSPSLPESLDAIMASQTLLDFDFILVDYSSNPEVSATLKQCIKSLEENYTMVNSRYLRFATDSLWDAFNYGIQMSRSQLVALFRSGDVPDREFSLDTINAFADDYTSIIIPLGDEPVIYDLLFDPKSPTVNINSLIKLKPAFIPIVARACVFKELGGFDNSKIGGVAFRLFILKAINRAWQVHLKRDISLSFRSTDSDQEIKDGKIFDGYFRAQVIIDGYQDAQSDTHYLLRLETGGVPEYKPEDVENARKFLKYAPPDWYEMKFARDSNTLYQTVVDYPGFSPAYYLLGQQYKAEGKLDDARLLLERHALLHPGFTG